MHEQNKDGFRYVRSVERDRPVLEWLASKKRGEDHENLTADGAVGWYREGLDESAVPLTADESGDQILGPS